MDNSASDKSAKGYHEKDMDENTSYIDVQFDETTSTFDILGERTVPYNVINSSIKRVSMKGPYRCLHCHDSYATKSLLIFHNKYYHQLNPSKALSCDTCDFVTCDKKSYKKLLKHFCQKHEKFKQFRCELCYKFFEISKRKVVNHIKVFHKVKGEKPDPSKRVGKSKRVRNTTAMEVSDRCPGCDKIDCKTVAGTTRFDDEIYKRMKQKNCENITTSIQSGKLEFISKPQRRNAYMMNSSMFEAKPYSYLIDDKNSDKLRSIKYDHDLLESSNFDINDKDGLPSSPKSEGPTLKAEADALDDIKDDIKKEECNDTTIFKTNLIAPWSCLHNLEPQLFNNAFKEYP